MALTDIWLLVIPKFGIGFGSLALQPPNKNSPIFHTCILYVRQPLTETPNLNPPIFLQWLFGAHLPSLINISGYTV